MTRVALPVFLALLLAMAVGAVEHPFILWNAQDITALKQRVKQEAWAKEAYDKLLADPGDFEKDLADLLKFAVEDDAAAAQRQKTELFRMVRSDAPWGGSQWINIVRYDLLYNTLTDAERQEVEKMFRSYVDTALFSNAVKDVTDGFVENPDNRYSRYDSYLYSRNNWLPNIVFPRRVSANLMAAALGDETLIRQAWTAYGSLQWFFDEYLADSGFYGEEFSKMGSAPGELLLYCRAVDRLGLRDLGFDYVGRHGASMRGFMESVIRLGYPRVDLGSERPQYPTVTAGDLRGSGSSKRFTFSTFAFQQNMVTGYLPNGSGRLERFVRQGAWGGAIRRRDPNSIWDGYSGFTPKMQIPLWFEISQQQWPDSGFAYFLAQMREPGQNLFYPSLYFGLEPIDPAKVKAPPAYSYVATQRGIAMLRAEESPAYWESPAPAVAMRLAAPYAHSVNDAFALAGFYAFNRPIYLNRQVTPGYAAGWTRSALSHNSVTVDGKEPGSTEEETTRDGFFPAVKFFAVRSQHVFPGIDQERALFLTREYMLDCFHLAGLDGQPHRYLWLAHALGVAQNDGQAWAAPAKLPAPLEPFDTGRALAAGDAPWRVTALQSCALPDPAKAAMPAAWYDRKVGVQMQMLGVPGTTVYLANTPTADTPDKAPKLADKPTAYEVGGVSVIAERTAPATTFSALHIPFAGDSPRVRNFSRLGEDATYEAVQIGGPDDIVNDRAFIQFGDSRTPVTVTQGEESYTFAGYAFVRITADTVAAYGDVRRLSLRVPGQVTFTLNGRRTLTTLVNGVLTFDSRK